MRVPRTARRSNQSILKEINPEYSLEGVMLKLKIQYSGHLIQRDDSLEKTLMLGRSKRGQELGVGEGPKDISCSVAKLFLTLYDSMDRSTPGFPVHHHLPEPAQTHVHRVGDAIQPSHPQLPPSPSALNLSQHRGLFQ